jgi:hypothetical protein
MEPAKIDGSAQAIRDLRRCNKPLPQGKSR